LPAWLRPAYVGEKTFKACVAETLEILAADTRAP